MNMKVFRLQPRYIGGAKFIDNCDYLGRHQSFANRTILVSIPMDTSLGFQCVGEMIPYAERDLFSYCHERQIYPITFELLETLQMNGSLKIKRSSGRIENGWFIIPHMTTFFHKNCGICVQMETHGKFRKRKGVSIRELFKLNKLNCSKVKFIEALRDSLDNHYSNRFKEQN